MNPSAIFVDTSFIYALINPRDQWHSVALDWRRKLKAEKPRRVLTEYILMETGDGLSAIDFRLEAKAAIDIFIANPWVDIVPSSSDLFKRSLDLYASRPDKNWGLTDCSSFVVMKDLGIQDALTTDDHFRQAGFNAVMLN